MIRMSKAITDCFAATQPHIGTQSGASPSRIARVRKFEADLTCPLCSGKNRVGVGGGVNGKYDSSKSRR